LRVSVIMATIAAAGGAMIASALTHLVPDA